jgi:hypothetical protein
LRNTTFATRNENRVREERERGEKARGARAGLQYKTIRFRGERKAVKKI